MVSCEDVKCFKCNIPVNLELHPFSKKEGVFMISARCPNHSYNEHLFEVKSKDVLKVEFKLGELWKQGIITDQPFQGDSLYSFQTEDARKEIIF